MLWSAVSGWGWGSEVNRASQTHHGISDAGISWLLLKLLYVQSENRLNVTEAALADCCPWAVKLLLVSRAASWTIFSPWSGEDSLLPAVNLIMVLLLGYIAPKVEWDIFVCSLNEPMVKTFWGQQWDWYCVSAGEETCQQQASGYILYEISQFLTWPHVFCLWLQAWILLAPCSKEWTPAGASPLMMPTLWMSFTPTPGKHWVLALGSRCLWATLTSTPTGETSSLAVA